MKSITNLFKNARVLVVGDVMLDRYWYGDTERISPEAPVPVVHMKSIEDRPGGAGNVAVNISSLGGNVSLLGLVGDDSTALIVEKELQEANVDCSLFRVPGVSTINKLRVIGQNQQLIRLDSEENFGNYALDELFDLYKSKLVEAEIVILSDYNKGTLSNSLKFIEFARSLNIPVLVDPKSKNFKIYKSATVITPNLHEFEAIVGRCIDQKDLEEKALALIKKFGFESIIITRGSHGLSLVSSKEPVLHLPTEAREVYDVTGAGDTFIATLGLSLSTGSSLHESVMLANKAAGIVVGKLGTASVTLSDLYNFIDEKEDSFCNILTKEKLKECVEKSKAKNEKIIMTNGCFDILLPGHINYLKKAKELGHRLIVAVNDDDSVKRLKGDSRPINKLEHRMQMLSVLQMVDWVVPFSEDTPEAIINIIKPDILVKGGDYKVHEVVGADFVLSYGGAVIIIPFIEGFSTSSIIDKIKGDER